MLIHQGLVCYGRTNENLRAKHRKLYRQQRLRWVQQVCCLLLPCWCRQTRVLPPDWPVCWFAFCCEAWGFTGRLSGSESEAVPHLLIREQSHNVYSSRLTSAAELSLSSLPIRFICATEQNIFQMFLTYSTVCCIHDRAGCTSKVTKHSQTRETHFHAHILQ